MNLIDFVAVNINKSDAEIVTLANTPIKRPKTLIHGATIANTLGFARSTEVLTAISVINKPLYDLLMTGGVEPTNPEAPIVVGLLVQAGVITAEEADILVYTTTWLVDGFTGNLTEDDVLNNRPRAERLLRLERMQDRIVAWQNEFLNPAISNFNLLEPTANDLKIYLES